MSDCILHHRERSNALFSLISTFAKQINKPFKLRPASRRMLFQIAFLVLTTAVSLSAQTITGSVRGQVTDQSGAVVPGAAIQVINVETGVATKKNTDSAGVYNIQFLPIGNYRLSATAAGFTKADIGPFDLQIDQTVSLNVKLTVGSTSETVKVDAGSAPLLDTENATLGATISANTLVNLPNNGLNFQTPALFMPGAVTTSLTSMTGGDATERASDTSDSPSFNGNREQADNYILDGVEINETADNTTGYNPAPASLQEMRVISGNADAEYGNASGGEVISVTKGGTNSFHGSAYDYLRSEILDANSWAANNTGIAKSSYTQNQFGATFGGPILKNKLFFFGDFEGLRYHTGGQATASVPTSAMRSGDFSQLLSVKAIQLYNTQNAFKPYVNNQIPITNPAAKYLFANQGIYPLPNHTALDGLTQADYVGYTKSSTVNNQGDLRVDYSISDANKLMSRFTMGDAYNFTTHPVLPIAFAHPSNFPFQSMVFNYVHTFGPSLVNELRAGFSRLNWNPAPPVDTTGLFGSKGDSLLGLTFPNQPYAGFTEFSFSGSDASVIGTNGAVNTNINNTLDYGDDFVWQHGKQTTKFGAQFVRYQVNFEVAGNDGALGIFSYTGQFTANPTIGGTTASGFPLADFALDEAYSAGVGAAPTLSGQRQWRDAYYIQDDWKILRTLTVNLGARYAYDQPLYEIHNKEVSVNLSNPSLGIAGLEFAGQNGNSQALYNPYYLEFMPRLGFSWQPISRFVIRGGYGITDDMEGIGIGTRMTQNAPYVYQFAETASTPTKTSSGSPLLVESGFATGTSNVSVTNTKYNVWSPNLRPALVQAFNLTTEYEFSSNTTAQLAYVGQIGQHLINWEQMNQWPAPCTSTCTTAPFYGLVGQTGTISAIFSEAISNYNAMQATLRHRQSNGLEYGINYTWSHTLSDATGIFGVANVDGPSVYSQNAHDVMNSYGPAGYDTRNNLTATAVYQLPFGRGKVLGGNWNRATDEALGGWKLSGASILYTGFPITINSSNNANINDSASRAMQYLPLHIVHQSVTDWFGTDPSATPCSGTSNGTCAYGTELPNGIGTARVGTERGPVFRQIDLSAFKEFPTFEGQFVQFRADFFNAFNIVSYSQPTSTLPSTTFGQITSSRSSPRNIQFELEYRF